MQSSWPFPGLVMFSWGIQKRPNLSQGHGRRILHAAANWENASHKIRTDRLRMAKWRFFGRLSGMGLSSVSAQRAVSNSLFLVVDKSCNIQTVQLLLYCTQYLFLQAYG